LKGHDVFEHLVGGIKPSGQLDTHAGIWPSPGDPRTTPSKAQTLIVTHQHGKRQAELELEELEKIETENLNMLFTRQESIINAKRQARLDNDDEEVQILNAQLAKVRVQIEEKELEIDSKKKQRANE
jgi:hypothetical protein